MLAAVVLGNRINDDGSMSDIMKNRLDMAIEVFNAYVPDKIILSGGTANKKVNVSEAKMMFDYLAQSGIPKETLIMEDKSLTTKQNALFSVPIAVALGADELRLCTSSEHLNRKFLNPIKLFRKQLQSYPHIKLSVYCK